MAKLTSKEKILNKAKLLFAEKGFAGVSMRHLASSVNMSVAALYHYFSDKNSLYLETMRYAFADKATQLTHLWHSGDNAEDKLRHFVKLLLEMLEQDPIFDRLLQREILEANPERIQILATDIFNNQFCYLLELVAKLAPKADAHLTAISVLSLIKYHHEIKALRRFWQGWKPEHEQADVIAEHVLNLLLNGIQKEQK